VAAILVFAVATCVTTALWLSARGDLREREQIAADERHAEQIATDYALGASTIDFQDLDSWVTRLKANTIAELGNKFDATAPKLREILIPLKWTSSAQPLAARVTTTEAGGVYHVSVFLDVDSTNAQSPDGGRMTVTYNVTVDRNAGWKVTDVGGMEGALPVR
jgi:Mce-associated membrane protein